MEVDKIRALTLQELVRERDEAQREFLNLRFRLTTKQLVNYREIRRVKKKIAQVETIMREKELTEERKG